MTQVSVLILEDEYYTRKYLKTLLLENDLTENVIDTDNSQKAVDLTTEFYFDIVLLDIELKGQKIKGLETARLLKQVYPDIELIFITAHSMYSLDSFSVHPFDYIIKPIDEEKLLASLDLLITKIQKRKLPSNNNQNYDPVNRNSRARLILEEPRRKLFIPINDIDFLEKQKNQNKVLIYLQETNKIYESTEKLHELEAELTDDFMRTHRSYIVNLNKVIVITEIFDRSYEIEFSCGEHKALLSRSKFEEFQTRMLSKGLS